MQVVEVMIRPETRHEIPRARHNMVGSLRLSTLLLRTRYLFVKKHLHLVVTFINLEIHVVREWKHFLVFVLFIVPMAVNILAIVTLLSLHFAEKNTPGWDFYQGLRAHREGNSSGKTFEQRYERVREGGRVRGRGRV